MIKWQEIALEDMNWLRPSVIEKHQSGKHDQKTHGQWAGGADTPSDDYTTRHRPAMGPDEGASLDNLMGANNDIYPADVYTSRGRQVYGTGNKELDKKAHALIMEYRGKPEKPVTIYRAVPKDIDAANVNRGDWVTPIREYAVFHGEGPLGGDFQLLTRDVKAKEIFTSGDSWLEWGYSPSDVIKHQPSKHDQQSHGAWAKGSLRNQDEPMNPETAWVHEATWYHGTSRPDLDVLDARGRARYPGTGTSYAISGNNFATTDKELAAQYAREAADMDIAAGVEGVRPTVYRVVPTSDYFDPDPHSGPSGWNDGPADMNEAFELYDNGVGVSIRFQDVMDIDGAFDAETGEELSVQKMLEMLKHQAGKHDQRSHGAWAGGGSLREGWSQRSKEDVLAEFQARFRGFYPNDPEHADNMAEEFADWTTKYDGPNGTVVNVDLRNKYDGDKRPDPETMDTALRTLDRLQTQNPVKDLVVNFSDTPFRDEADLVPESASGFVIRGEKKINLRPRYATDLGMSQVRDDGHFMPAAQGVSAVEYYLTHEYGHVVDKRNRFDIDDDTINMNNAIPSPTGSGFTSLGNSLSGYGRINRFENYAEAHAEWSLTDGETTNPASTYFAEKYNWADNMSKAAGDDEVERIIIIDTFEEGNPPSVQPYPKKKESAVIKFIPGLRPLLKHYSGRHDQKTHGRGSQGVSPFYDDLLDAVVPKTTVIKLSPGLRPVLKHEGGGHDQKSHGAWARGRGDFSEWGDRAERIRAVEAVSPDLSRVARAFQSSVGANYDDVIEQRVLDDYSDIINQTIEERQGNIRSLSDDEVIDDYGTPAELFVSALEAQGQSRSEAIEKFREMKLSEVADQVKAQAQIDYGMRVRQEIAEDLQNRIEPGIRDVMEISHPVTINGMPDSVNTTVTEVFVEGFEYGSPVVTIKGTLTNDDGVHIGSEWHRELRLADDSTSAAPKLEAENKYLILTNEDYKRQGFATAFNERTYDMYIANGIDTVKVRTAADGGVVWAMRGFDWDGDYDGHNMSVAHYALNNVLRDSDVSERSRERAALMLEDTYASSVKDVDMPTPMEIVMLGYEPNVSSWAGARAMWGMGWNGEKLLTPDNVSETRSRKDELKVIARQEQEIQGQKKLFAPPTVQPSVGGALGEPEPAGGVPRVRTPEGAAKYGLPIGAPIVAKKMTRWDKLQAQMDFYEDWLNDTNRESDDDDLAFFAAAAEAMPWLVDSPDASSPSEGDDDLPPTVVIKFMPGLFPVLKHLPGKHDQKTHGQWAAGAAGGSGDFAEWGDRASRIQAMRDIGPDLSSVADAMQNGLRLSVENLTDDEIRERYADRIERDGEALRENLENATLDDLEQSWMTPNLYGLQNSLYASGMSNEEVARELKKEILSLAEQNIVDRIREIDSSSSKENAYKNYEDTLTPGFEAVMNIRHPVTVEGMPDGVNTEVTRVELYGFQSGSGVVNVYGTMTNDAGQPIGDEWHRQFRLAEDSTSANPKLEVENKLLKITDPDYTRQGFATVFNEQSYDMYIANGIDTVKVQTAWDGGVVWAKRGFDWDDNYGGQNMNVAQEALNTVMYDRNASESARTKAEDLLNGTYVSGGVTDANMPTPMEVAMLGYTPGDRSWPGERAMSGMGWQGVKYLTPQRVQETADQKAQLKNQNEPKVVNTYQSQTTDVSPSPESQMTIDELLEPTFGSVPRVRTPEGSDKYGLPIGAPIVAKEMTRWDKLQAQMDFYEKWLNDTNRELDDDSPEFFEAAAKAMPWLVE